MDTTQTKHFKLLSATTAPITPALVAEWRALKPSVTERDFDERHANYLLDKIRAGNAVSFHWAKARKGNDEIRMNGQHSGYALEKLNGEFPAGLQAHIDTYEVYGDEGEAQLFRQFDDRRSNRDRVDVSGAYQMLEPELQGVNRKIAKRAVEAIGWHDQHVEKVGKLVGDDVYTLFAKPVTHAFILWQGELFSLKTKELEAVPIVAAMWRMWNKNQGHAKIFWDLTARGGEAGDESHPATRLDEWLLAAKLKELPKNPAPGEYYNGCVYAWNAYRKDENIRAIKHDTTKGLNEPIE